MHTKLLKYLSLLKITGNKSTRRDQDDCDQYPNNYVFHYGTHSCLYDTFVFFAVHRYSTNVDSTILLFVISFTQKSVEMFFNYYTAKNVLQLT